MYSLSGGRRHGLARSVEKTAQGGNGGAGEAKLKGTTTPDRMMMSEFTLIPIKYGLK